MQDPLDAILFYDDLTPAQQDALRVAGKDDPALAETVAHWQQVRAAVRQSLNAHVPDRRLFVLYALDASGRSDVLSDEEHLELDAARPMLDEAVQVHPALADVAGQVEAACADFEACWTRHFSDAEQAAPQAGPERKAGRHAPVRRMVRWSWRVAAAVALVGFVAVMTLMLQRDRSLTSLTVAEGQTQLVELADGSTVRLLGGSTLTYADPGKATAFNRRVTLTGRAFFDIAPDQQGFTVETPTALTTVLGTSFGIQADDDAMEVVLATGSISVASKALQEGMVVLQPGQVSRVTRNALPSTPTPVDLSEALEWTGLFIFQATPLNEVAGRLSDHYSVAVTVAPALDAERVNGTFTNEQTLQQILTTLATTLDATVRGNDADGYTIEPAEQ